MRELVEIEAAASHSCGSPKVERWHVLEPMSGRWIWLKVYACCHLVFQEPSVVDESQELAEAFGGGDEEIEQAA